MSGDSPEDEAAATSLVELFPHLAREPEEIPFAPVHVRALAFEEGTSLTLGFVVWKDPGGAAALRRELGRAIEAALLALLARPASQLAEEGERRPSTLRLLCFDALPADAAAALAPFGLRPVPYDPVALASTMSHVRGEAQRCGAPLPEEPTSLWEVPVALPEADRGVVAQQLEAMLREALATSVWGESPGAFFRALSSALGAIGEAPLALDTSAIERIEATFGQLRPQVLRWIPPLAFQALCDAIGVVGSKEFGRRVDWAACEPDDDGIAPPPLLRAKLPDGVVHLPIGEHLLRWSIMPLAEGEVPPPLAEWMLDQFGERGAVRG